MSTKRFEDEESVLDFSIYEAETRRFVVYLRNQRKIWK